MLVPYKKILPLAPLSLMDPDPILDPIPFFSDCKG
jgi:hypothetical protein